MREPESAKRFRDVVAVHRVVLSVEEIMAKRFVAIRLADGSSDGVLYDTRDDAVRHQVIPDRCMYLPIPLERWSENVCDTLLWYGRRAYDAGYRPTGAHEGAALIIPHRMEDM